MQRKQNKVNTQQKQEDILFKNEKNQNREQYQRKQYHISVNVEKSKYNNTPFTSSIFSHYNSPYLFTKYPGFHIFHRQEYNLHYAPLQVQEL